MSLAGLLRFWLTDEKYFGGSLQDLKAVIEACPGVPVLRKEFIIDKKQIYETARAGAHAVLLIASALKERLAEFVREAKQYGIETLVEVRDLNELTLAQAAGAEIIGVNNRNLTTFEVSLQTSIALRATIFRHPSSPLPSRGFLTALRPLKCAKPALTRFWLAKRLSKRPILMSCSRSLKMLIKICGLQSPETAAFAAEEGADFVGMV